jgi:hypothetical protein
MKGINPFLHRIAAPLFKQHHHHHIFSSASRIITLIREHQERLQHKHLMCSATACCIGASAATAIVLAGVGVKHVMLREKCDRLRWTSFTGQEEQAMHTSSLYVHTSELVDGEARKRDLAHTEPHLPSDHRTCKETLVNCLTNAVLLLSEEEENVPTRSCAPEVPVIDHLHDVAGA